MRAPAADNAASHCAEIPMSDDRDALRQQLRAARRSLPAAQRLAAADALAERLLALPFAPQQGAVAGYWAMDGEIALHRWQLSLPPGVRYCLPVLDGRVLRFAPWKPGQGLVSNRYGIPEPDVDRADTLGPEDMDLVVTPLTGFDAACGRLGMGAAGMIAASRSGIARRRRPGWSAWALPRSRFPPCPSPPGTCRWMPSAPNTPPS